MLVLVACSWSWRAGADPVVLRGTVFLPDSPPAAGARVAAQREALREVMEDPWGRAYDRREGDEGLRMLGKLGGAESAAALVRAIRWGGKTD